MSKTVLLTGANRGLGRATAEHLAAAGHRLELTARTHEKAERTGSALGAAFPECQISAHELELASFASVRSFARGIVASGTKIDVLLLNAGNLFAPPSATMTADGIEETLQINAVSQLLLARLLLPALRRPSRIIAVGSSLHHPDSRGEAVAFRFDDPHLAGPGRYHPDRAYKNSKLALLWVVYELERRLEGTDIHADAVCPGFIPRNAANGPNTRLTAWQRFGLRYVLPLMPFASSVEGSATELAKLVDRLEGRGGRYFHRWRPADSSPDSRDGAHAARFWDLACEWADIDPVIELKHGQ